METIETRTGNTAPVVTQAFAYGSRAIRAFEEDGVIWFVATDLAHILGFTEASDMTRILDDDEKGLILVQTPGGPQSMITINESGFYAAILRSRKRETKTFRRWVTHEVLPSIRRSGHYQTPAARNGHPGTSQLDLALQIGTILPKLLGDLRDLLKTVCPDVRMSNVVETFTAAGTCGLIDPCDLRGYLAEITATIEQMRRSVAPAEKSETLRLPLIDNTCAYFKVSFEKDNIVLRVNEKWSPFREEQRRDIFSIILAGLELKAYWDLPDFKPVRQQMGEWQENFDRPMRALTVAEKLLSLYDGWDMEEIIQESTARVLRRGTH